MSEEEFSSSQEQVNDIENENQRLKQEIIKLNERIKELTERNTDLSLLQENLKLKETCVLRESENQELKSEITELHNRIRSNDEMQNRIQEPENDMLNQIIGLCAKFAHINPERIPSAEDLNDPECLGFLIHQLTTSFELQQANIKKLERDLKIARQTSSTISPEVCQLVEKVQRTCSELTQTLHDDHQQLVQIMTVSEDPFEEILYE